MIYIVIPVYNRLSYTKACIESLYKQSSKNFKIVIVDDGSTDGTYETIKDNYPDVILVKSSGNLFWTASVNLGIKKSLDNGADYILTLNNDLVADKELIEKMYAGVKKYPNAIIGSLEIDIKTQEVSYLGEKLNWFSSKYYPLKVTELSGLKRVTHLPGRGMLIPRIVFEKVGFFAEKVLPHYLADYDFTIQASKKGFYSYINYDAKVYTYPEESGDMQNRLNKNFKNYYNHLFTIKGGGNLKDHTIFTLRNCPKLLIPTTLLIGYLRRISGFLLK